MIPLVVSLRKPESHTFRLWIARVLVWLLILPLGVLLTPFIFIASLLCGVNPIRGVAVTWQILYALTNLKVEVEHRRAGYIHIF